MTPTEHDKELRRAIIGIVEAEYKMPNYIPAVERIEHIMQLITADMKRVALEARLDELIKAFTEVVGDKNAPSSRYSKVTRLFNKYLLERHKQLKAQQEEV